MTKVTQQQQQQKDEIGEKVREIARQVLGEKYHVELHQSSMRFVRSVQDIERLRPYLRQVFTSVRDFIETVPKHGTVLLLYIHNRGFGVYIPTNMPNSYGIFLEFNKYGIVTGMRLVKQRQVT